ncbi:hypothetical protein OESDEN_21540 [Oesophagostomum dentatum]|uniref:Uncharacterized protein n=1 Tax=Oesophagostomum dentatum TaxID=61180 RepID=A0A0B1S1M0_OESDE|nr:hypothetical protein OESDEN_21540 [Oesophagostomum dentatum]
MTISDKEASIMKKELKHKLTPQQQKVLDD